MCMQNSFSLCWSCFEKNRIARLQYYIISMRSTIGTHARPNKARVAIVLSSWKYRTPVLQSTSSSPYYRSSWSAWYYSLIYIFIVLLSFFLERCKTVNMSGYRDFPSRRSYSADEVASMLDNQDFLEPCYFGSDDDLSAEELESDHETSWYNNYCCLHTIIIINNYDL